jgi:hypothetical protein
LKSIKFIRNAEVTQGTDNHSQKKVIIINENKLLTRDDLVIQKGGVYFKTDDKLISISRKIENNKFSIGYFFSLNIVKGKKVRIEKSGALYDMADVALSGVWALQNLADLLPFDYQIN